MFSKFAKKVSDLAGRPISFGLAFLLIVVWLVSGPLFHFTDTWQLVINTGTTIITFLMVFLIQSTQNREAAATQVKLDEIIRSIGGASNSLIDVEDASTEQLERLQVLYAKMGKASGRTLDAVDEALAHIELEAKGMEKEVESERKVIKKRTRKKAS